MPDDYDIGYGKPPITTRFKKGRSGNPKGRSKGTKNLKTDLAEELRQTVAVREGETTRSVTKQRAMVKALMAKAIKGDTRAAGKIIDLINALLGLDQKQGRARPLTAEEEALIEVLKAKESSEVEASQYQEPMPAGSSGSDE